MQLRYETTFTPNSAWHFEVISHSWCLLVISDLNVTGAVVDVYGVVGERTSQPIPPVISSSFNLL